MKTAQEAVMAWGVPDQIKTDNGSDFVAQDTQRLFASLDIEMELSDAYSPEQKGHVERVIGTFQRDVLDQMGFTPPIADDCRTTDLRVYAAGPMGVAIGINFQPTGEGKAAITGDFVLSGDEVNPVIVALRTHGIEVTALHSHMLDEQPRLFFMHFWANDDAIKLAKGLRAALDKTSSTKN